MVVFAVGTAYLQVIASAARVETAKAQLASARELDQQTANRVKNEVSPEIDSIRAQVERQSAEQRLTNAANQLEKDKLTLARIIGMAVDQEFVLTDPLASHPTIGNDWRGRGRAKPCVHAPISEARKRASAPPKFTLRAQKAQRLPVVSLTADYGGGGTNIGNFSQVYTLAGNISVPLYTGRPDRGRYCAGPGRPEPSQEAEYQDLKGRVAYDVRVAWLDLTASDSSVKVAARQQVSR